MASIYKPTYLRTDPQTGRPVRRRYHKWYIQFTDETGQPRVVPGFHSKRATEEQARRLEERAELIRAGVHSARTDHRTTPLHQHRADFESYLQSRGNTPKHVSMTISQVKAACLACRFDFPPDLSAGRLSEWLAQRRHDGLSARTSNAYLVSMKAFARWMTREGRLLHNPFDQLHRLNPQTDRKLQRRTLDRKEFLALLQSTEAGQTIRGLPGPDRAQLYLLAAYTGLRAAELASLTPASFDFSQTPPIVTVEAAYSKRRRRDQLPLHPDVARSLQSLVTGRPAGETLWPGNWRKRSSLMIQADLRAAGVEFEVAKRQFDFHALRHQFITSLALSGAHPKVAQDLARHSTITLTMDLYAHLGLAEMARAIEALPPPPRTGG